MLTSRLVALVGAVLSLVASVALLPGAALAGDTVYWGDLFSNKLAFADLHSGSSNILDVGAAPVLGPFAVTIDAAAGRIYWLNSDADPHGAIEFANLDGSDPHELNVGDATVSFPLGIAVEPGAGRVWWANNGDNTIAFAKTDDSGVGKDLRTGDATVDRPAGIAVDPAAGRVYWANTTIGASESIAFAQTDDSGVGKNLALGNAVVKGPFGVAVDPVAGRVYWANTDDNTIQFAKTDDSGVGDKLAVGNAAVSEPGGVAIDPTSGTVYWTNGIGAARVSFARADGMSSGDLVMGAPNGSSAGAPALLLSPRPSAPPLVTGGAVAGSVLSCTEGSWAPDFVASFLYQAPQGFAYQWSRDGTDIPGATQSTVTAGSAGSYRCRVTARNHAGATDQTSEAHGVLAAAGGGPGPGPSGGNLPLRAFGASTRVTLTPPSSLIPARGVVGVRVTNVNPFAISVTLAGQTTQRVAGHKRVIKFAAKSVRVGAGAKATVKLALPASLKRLLARQRKLSLILSATIIDPTGHRRIVKKTISIRLRPHR
jgi:DNA-binding beta-propeller fold protein YncE